MAATASSQAAVVTSRKRKARRRRQDKPALSARLVLDDHVKGDVGILSEDLFSNLFPQLRNGKLRLHSLILLPIRLCLTMRR